MLDAGCRVCEVPVPRCVTCDFYGHLSCYGKDEFLDEVETWPSEEKEEVHPVKETPKSQWQEKTEKIVTELSESVKNIQEEQRNMKKSLFSMNYAFKKQEKSLLDIENRLEDMEQSLTDLFISNMVLDNNVRVLENKVNNMEVESKRNNLEIHGVPEQRGERTEDIVMKIGYALGVHIDWRDIDYARRIQSKPEDQNRPRGIDVRFNSHRIKTEVIRVRKERPKLTTKDIGLDNNKRKIYINEPQAAGHKLHKTCHKQNRIKYVWVKDGKLFCRKKNGCKVVEMKRPEEFNNIRSCV